MHVRKTSFPAKQRIVFAAVATAQMHVPHVFSAAYEANLINQ
jgi:hypothetical protein